MLDFSSIRGISARGISARHAISTASRIPTPARTSAETDQRPKTRLRELREDAVHKRQESKHSPGEPEAGQRLFERWLPPAWRNSRLDPGRLGLLGLVLGGLVVVAVLVFGVWSDQPSAEPVPRVPPISPAMSPPKPPTPPSPGPTAEPVVVSVVGLVVRPGLVTIEPGQRVADALRAAGGPVPGADVTATLNLARKLTDGEQLYIGVPAPPQVPGAAEQGSGPAGADGRVDLNAASAEQLESLPGVGEVTAERIVRWRNDNGRFASAEQLREVGGVGDARFAQLRDRIRV